MKETPEQWFHRRASYYVEAQVLFHLNRAGVFSCLDESGPMSVEELEKANAELEIAVLRLPSLSNFSDLDPLEAEPSVQLRWVQPGEALGQPDAVVLPGSKQTLRDLKALQASGLAMELQRFSADGGAVLGICGGLQMLGRELLDPDGLEGAAGASAAGLNLLPLQTRFGGSKALRQRTAVAQWPTAEPCPIEGFELHRGSTTALEPLQALCQEEGLGWVQGQVAGSYLHGLFREDAFRRSFLARLGTPASDLFYDKRLDDVLNRLADHLEEHLDIDALFALAR